MHPIEKVHKMIISGKVLGPHGKWLTRTEALKHKRYVLKHVLNGEIEADGHWVQLKSSDTNPVPQITENTYLAQKGEPRSSLEISTSDSVLSPSLPTKNTFEPISVHAASDGKRVPFANQSDDRTPFHNLPPQPEVTTQKITPDGNENDVSRSETITIRTIPLGKETSLTISESRADSALVAICSVRGFIDQSNSEDFHIQLISMLEFGVRFFIVDLEYTTLVGSAGWGVFAVASRLIKASSGILMICAMNNEIEETFYQLQFDEVIDACKTITECLDLIKMNIQQYQDTITGEYSNEDSVSSQFGESYDDLPLPERIKIIIAHNGPLSFFRILSTLKQQRYGKVKINPFRLYLLLRELNLETNFKRIRYYRSC